MSSTRSIGERTEARILGEMLQFGYAVSIPFGGSQKYDFIVDRGGILAKAQCKTGRIKNGCVIFNAFSVNGTSRKSVSYAGLIDEFIVYCPQVNKLYRVPVGEVGSHGIKLRIDKAKNGQLSGVRWAKDYEIKIPV